MRPFSRLVNTLLISGLLLSQLGACGPAPQTPADSNQGGSGLALTGAGSTFAAPFFQKLMDVYRANHPELHLSYEAVGSGEGINRFLDGSVDFGATDAPLTAAETEGIPGSWLQLPITAGMIAITYNLPGVESPLNLPRDVYADIFLGEIDRWSDPRIVAANPGVDLPHKLIQIVARLDSSGTTYAFTNHLAAISPEWADGPGVGKRIDWPGGTMVARGNEGVAQRVKITVGAIGYVESGFAERLHLALAWLENRAGGFVKPNVETGRRALAGGSDAVPDDLRLTITDPKGARSYPIVTYTWVLSYREYADPGKTAALKEMVRWALTSGQDYAEPLRYVPLPENVVQAALTELDQVGG